MDKKFFLPLNKRTIRPDMLMSALSAYIEGGGSSTLLSFLKGFCEKSPTVIYSIVFTLHAVTGIFDDIVTAHILLDNGFIYRRNRMPAFLYSNEVDIIKNNPKQYSMIYLIQHYGLSYDQAENLRDAIMKDNDDNIDILDEETDIENYDIVVCSDPSLVEKVTGLQYASHSITHHIEQDVHHEELHRKNSDWVSMLENVRNIKEAHENIIGDIYQKDINSIIDVDVEDPILVFSGDWHIGGINVDYERLLNHWKFIYESKGVYVITVGDLVDMFVSFRNRSVVFSQIVSPTEQLYILKTFLDDMFKAEKIVAVAFSEQSVHDAAIKATAGLEIYNILFQEYRNRVKFFHNKGVIGIRLPSGRVVKVAFQHKGSSSRIDPFRANYNLYRDYCQSADIYVGAHHHTGGYSSAVYGEKRRVMLNIGAFKKNDAFSVSYFNRTEDSTAYGIYIDGNNEKNIIGLVSDDIETLYKYREIVRRDRGAKKS